MAAGDRSSISSAIFKRTHPVVPMPRARRAVAVRRRWCGGYGGVAAVVLARCSRHGAVLQRGRVHYSKRGDKRCTAPTARAEGPQGTIAEPAPVRVLQKIYIAGEVQCGSAALRARSPILSVLYGQYDGSIDAMAPSPETTPRRITRYPSGRTRGGLRFTEYQEIGDGRLRAGSVLVRRSGYLRSIEPTLHRVRRDRCRARHGSGRAADYRARAGAARRPSASSRATRARLDRWATVSYAS